MSHYRIAIVAHFEQVDDCVPWNCYQDLKLAGHAVEMIETGYCKGLLVKGELDRGMLAPFIDVFQPDYIAYRGESAEEVLRNLGGTPAHDGPAPRHFVVSGYVGRDNFGDEFLFKTICERLRRDYPGCWVSLVGFNPTGSLARHGVASLPSREKKMIYALLNGASALIFMGGTLLDYEASNMTTGSISLFFNPTGGIVMQAALCEIAWLNDVPTVYLGIGAGPLDGADEKKMVKLASLTGPRFIARDEETKRLLLDAGVDEGLISRKADLAYAADYPEKTVYTARKAMAQELDEDAPYVAWALREHEPCTNQIEEAAAIAADALYEEQGLASVLLAFEPDDAEVNEQVKARMRHPEAALLLGTGDFDETCGIIGGATFAIAMRLHATIIAASQGVPAVGLDYNVKVAETYKQLGMGKYLLPADVSGERMVETCTHLLKERGEASRRVSEVAVRNRRLADEAFSEFEELVDSHEPSPTRLASPPRTVPKDAARSRDAQRKLKQTQSELKKAKNDLEDERKKNTGLQEELDRMRNSRTWRLRTKIRSFLHLK